MADAKISALTALTASAAATGDYVPVVDISEALDADKNKRITMDEMRKYVVSRRGARISRVTNAAASGASTDVLVPFTTEDYDTDSIADLGTSTTKLTVPAGWNYVRIGFYIRFTAGLTTTFGNVKKNGTFLTAAEGCPEIAAGGQALSAWSDYIAVNNAGGDYFELNTFGPSRTVSAAWFAMQLID